MAGRVTRIEINHETEQITVTEIDYQSKATYMPGNIWQVIGLLQNIVCEFAKRRGEKND
jgi:hypothetical protein